MKTNKERSLNIRLGLTFFLQRQDMMNENMELCVLTMRNKEVFWPAVTQTRLEETQLQRKLNWNSWNHFKVSWRNVHQLSQRSLFHLCRREVWEGVCDRENASLQCIKGRNVVQLPRKTFFLLSQAWDKEWKHIRSLTWTRTPDLRYCALMPCHWINYKVLT